MGLGFKLGSGVLMTSSDADKHNKILNAKKKERYKEAQQTLVSRGYTKSKGNNNSKLGKIGALLQGERLKICLVRSLGGLGDALILSPIFKAIKERFPTCHLTYGTTPDYSDGVLFDILKHNPHIDTLISHRKVKDNGEFDVYLDMTAVGVKEEYIMKSPPDRQSLWAQHVGVDLYDGKCVYVVSDEETEWAKEWIDRHKKIMSSRVVFIQPGSFAERRNWPREKTIKLIDELHDEDKSTVFLIHDYNVETHKSEWKNLPNTYDVSDLKIRNVAAIIDQCDLVIAHDSGMLHLAGALDKKIVSIFGSTHPVSRINWFKNCVAVWQKNLACAPCWYKPCNNHFYCMKALDVEDVKKACNYMLNSWDRNNRHGLDKLKNVDYFFGTTYAGKGKVSDLSRYEVFPVRRITKKEKNTKYDLSILMVTMDNMKYLQSTINDILKYTDDFELIIYQNARVPGSEASKYLDSLCKDNKNISLVKDSKNSGFLEPNNTIAKKARGKYICLLNDDMTLCKDWARIMINMLKSNQTLAQVGVSDTCTAINLDGNGTHGHVTEYIEASCMMMPRKIYDEYGLFDDENLHFAYHEDSDFSLRLREHGWNIATIDIPIVHHRGKTSAVIKEDLTGHQTKNRVYFLDRWKNYLKDRTFNYQIAVQRSGAIGDVLLTTPAIEGIKKKYPLSNITVITKCADILAGNIYVHRCVEKDRKSNYDMFYDLDDSYENIQEIHILDAYASSCNLNKEELGEISFKVNDYDFGMNDDYIVFHTGPTAWVGRDWKRDRFEELAKKVSDLGYKTVLIGTNGTPKIKCDVDLRGRTNLAQTGSVIKDAKCFVGIDSSPFHIAQSQNTPSVVFFGCINPAYRIVNDNVRGVSAKDLACLYCHHWKKGDKRATSACIRNGTEKCIDDVTVGMMYDNILEVINA